MAFIRVKNIKGNQYGYLVKSVWNDKLKRSEQTTLRFLGKEFSLDDIPKEYRSPAIKKYFARLATDGFPPQKVPKNHNSHVLVYVKVRARERKSQALRERRLSQRQTQMEHEFGMSRETFNENFGWRASL